MKKLLLFTLVGIFVQQFAKAQGCVAIRSMGNVCTMEHPMDSEHHTAKWLFNVNTRYFKSFRHFVGTEEQKERLEKHTEVINHSTSLDFSISHQLKNNWSVGLTIPLINNVRSSMYEHYGNSSTSPNARNNTNSFGLGDIRLSVYRWILKMNTKGNIQAGLGIKAPTGDYKSQDSFHLNANTTVEGPVDQSIQLGDGGFGFTTELNGYYNFSPTIGAYGTFFYLFNPQVENGVSTARGGTPNATAIAYETSTMSIPDQYMARAGASFTLNKFVVSAGMRIEGIPAYDLIGGSAGFRRPGYIISAEPVVAYNYKKVLLYAGMPYAVVRNRVQSRGDILRTEATGVYAQGDAAFADYAINLGISFKF